MAQRDKEDCPVWFDDPGDVGRLRDVLARANFTDGGVVEALGVKSVRSLSEHRPGALLRRTSGGRPIDTLIRLLLMGVPVEGDAAREAIAPMTLEDWLEAGLIEARGTKVRGTVQLLPFQGLLVAFDRSPSLGVAVSPKYVMGIGSSSLTLATLTVRRPSRLTLDLGTGCGFQAVLAARHSDRVVAVDRNPRAVSLARLNTRLNSLPNVECLEGDLFGPVEGRQFDLIVSNPPFVMSPERRYIYRDSGMAGDCITRTIVRRVPAFLSEGGYCQILTNWAHIAGQDWQERLAGWFEETGCDAWVMRSHTDEPEEYASEWIGHTERDDPDEFSRRMDRWLAYYREERIEAVSSGLIAMRRRSGKANWFRADDGAEKIIGSAGDAVARGFEAQDFLATMHDDSVLMAQCLRVSPDVRLEQRFVPSPQGWAMIESGVRLVRGLAYSGNADTCMANLIGQCDGQHRLGDLVDDMVSALEAERDGLARECLDVVRRLIERGFLVPEGPGR